ncbi:MAG: hypothetical protein RR355_00010 [Oscillospiraceae bacterium]
MNSLEELFEIRKMFIACCPSLPKIQDVEFWSKTRRNRTKALIKTYGADKLQEIFKAVEASEFLTGRSGKWSCCSYDWIIKPENIQKIAEGNYHNRDTKASHNTSYDINAAIVTATQKEIKYTKKCQKG